jgi:hypothetical protein
MKKCGYLQKNVIKTETPDKISENSFDFVGLYEENNLMKKMILIIWKKSFYHPLKGNNNKKKVFVVLIFFTDNFLSQLNIPPPAYNIPKTPEKPM